MNKTLVDRVELERALAQLKAAQVTDTHVRAAVDTIEHMLSEAEARTLLTTAEAADALGVRSVNTIKYWVKTGYIHGVKRNGGAMIPRSEVDRIMDEDRVRQMRSAAELDEMASELGRPMTDDEMRELSASRPGKLPWQR